MIQYLAKIMLTAALVVVISEVAKRSVLWGGLIASLPLTSLLAFVWLYAETRDAARVAALAASIYWLVLPSLALFLCLAVLLRAGAGFWLSLVLSAAVTVIAYALTLRVLTAMEIRT